MKCLKVLILLFSFSILCELTTTSANAAACPIVNGEITEAQIKEDCFTTPALYEIIVYEAYLCTSEAIKPSTTKAADLSNCTKVFENTDGAVASVEQNEDIDLEGKRFRPPNGFYTHAYAKLDNTFGITWSGKISGNMTSSSQNGNGAGQFCATVAGNGVFQNGSIHTNNAICGTSAITPGKFVETMNSFDFSSDQHTSPLIDDVPGNPGATIQGIITDVNGFATTGNSDSFRLEATMKNAKAITIDETTRGLTVKFSLAAAMDLKEETRDSDRIEVSSGPFIAIMTAQK